MFDIDNYFQNFIKNDSIFRDRDVLRPDFIPKILPHRDAEIRKIAEILACTFKNSTPSNIFIFGKTGTGKTAVINYVKEKLNYNRKLSGISETRWVYLNCQEVNTGYRILAKICNELKPEREIPISGWPLDVVFDKAVHRLDKYSKGYCFLVLDEIDILVNKAKKNHDVLYNLARINSKLNNTKVSLIGISNVLDFKKSLDPRVQSSLSEEEIIFPAYNAIDLRDILEQRAVDAFNEQSLDAGVIPLCGALAAKEHGDARKALDLLRKAGELAERHQEEMVQIEHVYMAQEEMESDKIREYYGKLPVQQKLIFLSIYKLYNHGCKNVITGDIYDVYSELQEECTGINKLTQRRVSELIRELDLAGLINAKVSSQGRYGRSKTVKLNIPLEDAYNYLVEEIQFSDIINYTPTSIRKNRMRITNIKQFI